MKIPNADHPVVDIRKLRDYCLSPSHVCGKHKARLFAAALGITSDNAEYLRDALLHAVKTYEAQFGKRDAYGQRYTVDFILETGEKQAVIRSAWIVECHANNPSLTTCYPLSL